MVSTKLHAPQIRLYLQQSSIQKRDPFPSRHQHHPCLIRTLTLTVTLVTVRHSRQCRPYNYCRPFLSLFSRDYPPSQQPAPAQSECVREDSHTALTRHSSEKGPWRCPYRLESSRYGAAVSSVSGRKEERKEERDNNVHTHRVWQHMPPHRTPACPASQPQHQLHPQQRHTASTRSSHKHTSLTRLISTAHAPPSAPPSSSNNTNKQRLTAPPPLDNLFPNSTIPAISARAFCFLPGR